MNWKQAIYVLRNGGKITRPNWEDEHYWELSKDCFERILCHNGDNASVHLQQIEADDWEIFKEEESLSDKILKIKNDYNCVCMLERPGPELKKMFDSIEYNVKKSIEKLQKVIHDDCGSLVEENYDGTNFVDWEEINKIIKNVFGEKLC